MRFAEPDPELVERAIVKVLEIAQLQGITAADFIQMLNSGMRIPDFLDAVGVFTNGHTVDCDTANLGFTGLGGGSSDEKTNAWSGDHLLGSDIHSLSGV